MGGGRSGLGPCAPAVPPPVLLALLSFDRPVPAEVWPRRTRRRSRWSAPRSLLLRHCCLRPATRSRDERPGRMAGRRYAPAERRRQGGQGSSAKRTPLRSGARSAWLMHHLSPLHAAEWRCRIGGWAGAVPRGDLGGSAARARGAPGGGAAHGGGSTHGGCREYRPVVHDQARILVLLPAPGVGTGGMACLGGTGRRRWRIRSRRRGGGREPVWGRLASLGGDRAVLAGRQPEIPGTDHRAGAPSRGRLYPCCGAFGRTATRPGNARRTRPSPSSTRPSQLTKNPSDTGALCRPAKGRRAVATAGPCCGEPGDAGDPCAPVLGGEDGREAAARRRRLTRWYGNFSRAKQASLRPVAGNS